MKFPFAPFVATEDHCTANWCGHHFDVGEIVHNVYVNYDSLDTKDIHGNPLICERCAGPKEVILKNYKR